MHPAQRRQEAIRIGVKLTIEDRTSEETEELDEQVLLLGGDFVPAVALAALLDFRAGDTLLDVGLEHLLGDGTRVGTSTRRLLGAELVPGLLLLLLDNLSIGVVGLGISVGRDVLLQSSVLVWRWLLVSRRRGGSMFEDCKTHRGPQCCQAPATTCATCRPRRHHHRSPYPFRRS